VKWVELRRHSERAKPAELLTDRGREAARELGKAAGRFDLVVSSTRRRATETAVAMGYRLFGVDSVWSTLWEGFDEQEPPLSTFGDFQRAFRGQESALLFGNRLLLAVQKLANGLPEGGRALVLTHGGLPELLVAAGRPDDFSLASEPVLGLLEGVRFGFDQGKMGNVEVLRYLSPLLPRGSSKA
jgi:broad specificity phosphatase PhoE